MWRGRGARAHAAVGRGHARHAPTASGPSDRAPSWHQRTPPCHSGHPQRVSAAAASSGAGVLPSFARGAHGRHAAARGQRVRFLVLVDAHRLEVRVRDEPRAHGLEAGVRHRQEDAGEGHHVARRGAARQLAVEVDCELAGHVPHRHLVRLLLDLHLLELAVATRAGGRGGGG